MRYSNHFFRFFPPPLFLEMPAVGVEISNRFVRFAELRMTGGKLVLGAYGEKEIPEGVISSGEIVNETALQEVLSALSKEYNLSFIRASLPEERGFLFTTQLPPVLKKEIRGSLSINLEDHVPLSPEEAIFDYETASCAHTKYQKSWDVSVSAMSALTIGRYVSAFSGAHLVPLSFELEAHALARALIQEGDCETFMIVDIGATHTGVIIVSGGSVCFTATIPLGGGTFTRGIAHSLNVSLEEAVTLKEKYGLSRHYGEGNLFSVLAPIIATLRDEVMRYILFWNTHEDGQHAEHHHGSLETVILCGGEANVPGLESYFSGSLKVNVFLGNPWLNITSFKSYVPELSREDSLRYATALGLALQGF